MWERVLAGHGGTRMPFKSITKTLVGALLAAATAVVAGCGVDDVQLNGKIFDAVGFNSTGSTKKEPNMAERQPLVVPPGLESLPQPGSGGAAGAPALAEIQDPDKKAKVSKEELQRQQQAYCKVNYEDAMARGDTSADLAEGPLGPCRGSIFTAIQKWNASTDDDDTTTQ